MFISGVLLKLFIVFYLFGWIFLVIIMEDRFWFLSVCVVWMRGNMEEEEYMLSYKLK